MLCYTYLTMIRVHYVIDSGDYKLDFGQGATSQTINLSEDEATQLVRDLIRTGIEIFTDKELALTYKLEAVEHHLNDMRRLVMLENEKGEV